MLYLFKQFIFSVLVLAIAASPVQFAMAFEAGQEDHAKLVDCQPQSILLADTVDHAEKKTCPVGEHEICVDHSDFGCTAQFSTSFYQDFSGSYISLVSAHLIKFSIDSETFKTHYPDRIARPPKA
jgi:hypothetical protein